MRHDGTNDMESGDLDARTLGRPTTHRSLSDPDDGQLLKVGGAFAVGLLSSPPI